MTSDQIRHASLEELDERQLELAAQHTKPKRYSKRMALTFELIEVEAQIKHLVQYERSHHGDTL
jgi:hypothetical protein